MGRCLVAALTATLILTACGPSSAVPEPTTGVSDAATAQASSITLPQDLSPILFGRSISLGFTLRSAGVGLAGAAVQVQVGSATVPITTSATGSAGVLLDSRDLKPGRQTVTVSYAGDAQHLAAEASTTVQIDPAESSIALTLTPTGTGAADAVATVTVGTGVNPIGQIAFTVDGAPLETQPVTGADGRGTVGIRISAGLAVGDHHVAAAFTPGVPAEVSAASGAAVLTLAKAASGVTAAAHKDVIRYGDQASFSVAVQPLGSPPGTDLTGAITVLDGATPVAEGTTDPTGAASLDFLNRADPGSKTYTVTYAGNAGVFGSQAEFAVQTSQTNVDIAISTPSLRPGDSGTVTVSVIGTPDRPTGTAVITVDGAEVANGPLDADGRISATLTSVSVGSHPVTVTYSGDVRFEANTASATLRVKEPLSNPYANGAASINADNPCPSWAAACVDLSNDRAWMQSGGTVTYGPVSITSGRPGYRTPSGTFEVYWRDKNHKSSLYDDAPMPNSVFFNGGIAFHAGSLSAQSHGCIHLSSSASLTFFDNLSVGDAVYVFGYAPY